MEWKERFDERQLRIIQNCREYARGDPAGLPGHHVMLIVARLADTLDVYRRRLVALAKEKGVGD